MEAKRIVHDSEMVYAWGGICHAGIDGAKEDHETHLTLTPTFTLTLNANANANPNANLNLNPNPNPHLKPDV